MDSQIVLLGVLFRYPLFSECCLNLLFGMKNDYYFLRKLSVWICNQQAYPTDMAFNSRKNDSTCQEHSFFFIFTLIRPSPNELFLCYTSIG